jgi:hypothetical protein
VEAQTFYWTIAATVLAGLTLIASIWFGSKTLKQTKAANQLATERSVVEWQIHRSDEDNAGRFRAYNVGYDTAYEVTVEAWDSHDRVTESVSAVWPTKPGGTAAYIDFSLEYRSQHGPDIEEAENFFLPRPKSNRPDFLPQNPLMESLNRQHQEMIQEHIRKQVMVEITWRSKLKRWSTVTMRTG